MGDEVKNIEQEYKQVQADLKKTGDELKQYAEQSQKEVKQAAAMSAELKQSVDEALTEHGKLSARLQDIEQKLARTSEDTEPQHAQTVGELIVNSEAFKSMNSSARKAVRVTAPRSALLNVPATTGNNTSRGNSLAPADRVPGIIMPGLRRMTIRDLLAPGTTTSNNVEYVRETGFTNAADVVSEGGDKPYSDLTFELENAPVRTIAHLFKASRQLLDDAAGLQSYIDARARYGLQLKEEQQFLYGNGTGQNLYGIVPQASVFSPALSPTNEQAIDRIRMAILQAVLAEFPANGVVLNPIDWATIELTKDLDGRYIIGNAINGTAPTLWNLPVVETTAMVQDQFLVGSFNLGAQVFDRMDIEVLISTENDKDFERNLVSIRAEERVALAVYRPESFVTGSVSGAASS